MKLATVKQILFLLDQGPGDKAQASSSEGSLENLRSNKHQAFFQDKVFNHPDVWYKIWLKGILEYLQKRQASSTRLQAPVSKLREK